MPIGAAIGGAVATVGGAAISSRAQKKTSKRVSQTAERTATANNALQSQVRAENVGIISPFVNRGNEAGTAINSLLGLGGSFNQAPPNAMSGMQKPNPTGVMQSRPDLMVNGGVTNETPFLNASNAPGGTDWNAYMNDPMNADALAARNADQPNRSLADYGQQHYALDGSRRDLTPYGGNNALASPAGATASPYQGAFQNYLDSTGYKFQMDQGTQAINQGYAARGSLQSGAAMKALQTYGQNTGASFFDKYLGYLSNQQGVGLSGANALAGVGTNYANQVSANNNNAGMVNAQAQMSGAQATAGIYGAGANALGSLANNAFGSSYRPSAPAPAWTPPSFNGLQRGTGY